MKRPILTVLACWILLLPLAASAFADGSPQTLDQLREVEAKLKELSPKLVECTVGLQIGSSRGSGIIVSKDGLILTAGHVCGKANEPCIIVLPDGKTTRGMTLGIFSSADAGMAKIIGDNEGDDEWPYLEPGTEADIVPGAWCVSAGHPGGWQKGRPPVIRLGRILNSESRVIQTDCPLIGGDSGGPLVNLDGKVIGINSRIGANLTMNYHVPIGVFHEVWDRLKKGETWKDSFPEKNDEEVRQAFRSILEKARECVVQIKCDDRNTILGTVVGPDGWILTKASEIKPEPICVFGDGTERPAEVIGIDPRFDLAMLKVEAEKLPAIPWQMRMPDVGQIVAATGLDEDPLALGVIGAPKRAIPRIAGMMGIMLKDAEGGVLVEKVVPGSPAEKAGIKDNDLVTHLNGTAVADRETLSDSIKKHRPGEKVRVTLKRDDESKDVEVTLARLLTDAAQRQDLLNRSGIGVSRRADDFPLVVQHDTVIRPNECGTPLVDLEGRVVGLNIARAGRTESYCVPANTLIVLMYDLMSGRLKPQPPPAEKKPEAKEEPKEDKPKDEPKQEEPKAEPEEKPKEEEPDSKPEEKPEPKEEPKEQPKQEQPKQEQPEEEPKAEPKEEQPDVQPEPEPPKEEPAPEEPPKAEETEPEQDPEPQPEVERENAEPAPSEEGPEREEEHE